MGKAVGSLSSRRPFMSALAAMGTLIGVSRAVVCLAADEVHVMGIARQIKPQGYPATAPLCMAMPFKIQSWLSVDSMSVS
jgi:hypothetical protein